MGDGSTTPGAGAGTGSGRADLGDVRVPRLRRTVATILVRGMGAATRWVTRLLGEEQVAVRLVFSTAELRDLVAHSAVLDRDERRLIDDVIVAGGRQVRELMVPRMDVVFLSGADSLADAARRAAASRHSRYPVIDGTHDDVMGFVHLRDLLVRPDRDDTRTVTELVRPLRRLPATKRVLAALSEMRRAGDHLALVVDEYGGTAGIVSLEDLIEELVGEIHDEYDAAPEPVDDREPTEVDGLLNLGDFAERVGFALPTGPYATVGGFIMAALGRLPVVGDEVRVDGAGSPWCLRVQGLEGRRVARVALGPVLAEPATVELATAGSGSEAGSGSGAGFGSGAARPGSAAAPAPARPADTEPDPAAHPVDAAARPVGPVAAGQVPLGVGQ
jgi:putative hemolysin